jgi:hypothetical protein
MGRSDRRAWQVVSWGVLYWADDWARGIATTPDALNERILKHGGASYLLIDLLKCHAPGFARILWGEATARRIAHLSLAQSPSAKSHAHSCNGGECAVESRQRNCRRLQGARETARVGSWPAAAPAARTQMNVARTEGCAIAEHTFRLMFITTM